MRIILILSFLITLDAYAPIVIVGSTRPKVLSPASGLTRTDDFNRADNADLGSNWTPITGEDSFEISANTAIPNTPTSDAGERWSGDSWTANQSSAAKITVTETQAGVGFGVCVRAGAAADTMFRVVINSDGEWELGETVTGTFTSIATGTTTYSAGAILKLTATGSDPTINLKVEYNGSTIHNANRDAGSSTLDTGSPGLFYSSNATSGSVDDWTGQDGL